MSEGQKPKSLADLYLAFARASKGFPRHVIKDAAANLVLDAIQQSAPTAEGATQLFDELATKMRARLVDHFYLPDGKKRSVLQASLLTPA